MQSDRNIQNKTELRAQYLLIVRAMLVSGGEIIGRLSVEKGGKGGE